MYIGLGLGKRGRTNTAVECQLSCQASVGCEWFNWREKGGGCWHKSGKGTRMRLVQDRDMTGPARCINHGELVNNSQFDDNGFQLL